MFRFIEKLSVWIVLGILAIITIIVLIFMLFGWRAIFLIPLGMIIIHVLARREADVEEAAHLNEIEHLKKENKELKREKEDSQQRPNIRYAYTQSEVNDFVKNFSKEK